MIIKILSAALFYTFIVNQSFNSLFKFLSYFLYYYLLHALLVEYQP